MLLLLLLFLCALVAGDAQVLIDSERAFLSALCNSTNLGAYSKSNNLNGACDFTLEPCTWNIVTCVNNRIADMAIIGDVASLQFITGTLPSDFSALDTLNNLVLDSLATTLDLDTLVLPPALQYLALNSLPLSGALNFTRFPSTLIQFFLTGSTVLSLIHI